MAARSDADCAAAIALAALPEVGPARLRWLMGAGPPAGTWQAVVADRLPRHRRIDAALRSSWQRAAAAIDPDALLARTRKLGVEVLFPDDERFPEVLRHDVAPPALLFVRGTLPDPDDPAVAIVGTRRCTRAGEDVAEELGASLAEAGATVVSGLALGIDAAAHRGALATAPPRALGIVANGLDRPYPRRNTALWNAVAAEGALIAEVPVGVPPSRWRFPSRNRLIAALADVVVVVESGVAGGSMHTVREADRRSRTIMAVPGGVRSRAAAGTNRLIADGCAPCLEPADVAAALGLGAAAARARREAPVLTPLQETVVDAIADDGSTLEHLVLSLARPAGEVATALAELEMAGAVVLHDGWYERRCS